MHFDLWPAPMRAGLCALLRLSIRGGVASTPECGGRPEAKQRPLDLGPRPQGDSRRLPSTWKGIMVSFAGARTPHPQS